MNSALFQLMMTQFRQYIREPQILFWSFGFPLLLVWLLGVSFSDNEVKEHTIGVVLPAQSEPAKASIKQWAEQMASTPHSLSTIVNSGEIKRDHLVKVKYRFHYYDNREEVVKALKRGDVQMFVELDASSGKRIYYLDPQNNDAMLTYFFLGDDPTRLTKVVEKNMSVLESPGLRYVDFLVPGLIAMAIMETCLVAVGWTLIEKRATKVTRQMRITPMSRHDFLAAHVLACFVFSFTEILVIYFFAQSYFDVHAQGGMLPFVLLVIAGNLCFAGIAILAASRALKAQTASGLLEVTILFLVIFSGIFFSYKQFPAWMVSVIEVLPLTILVDAMRMVFVEGAGVLDIAKQAAILSLIGIGTFVTGARVFRWY
ncbi:ABC-type multidrug transport system permease subunit [Chitinivorax tropicus]|uniref:ABC-type multidrug transport system permease subunit n=1 Tax=Chitinivorax tropicus TaxID=714531 RepID=A0A840MJ04_9PROT|nr:ABC transporter permease [Chitinivorax tropicus]MBB5016747.1 ABC-type multidrug transport system permease subunit [Chitinivorax tropicus]